MRVDIIIPVYNVSPYINRCLESVASQTYEDITCILIDDCGGDDSIKNIRQFVNYYSGNKEFVILHHNKNLGQGMARNTGILAAKGDYIFFLDSDDAISSDCIDYLVKLAEKYPDADFVQGSTIEGNKELATYHAPCITPGYINDKTTLEKMVLSTTIKTVWNRLIKRSFIINNDLFFPNDIANCEDLYWIYFMSKKNTAAFFSDKGTYYYYVNANSSSTSTSKSYTKKRVKWHNMSVYAIYMNMKKNSLSISRYQQQFLASFICNYMMQLCKFPSIKEWGVFWRLTIKIHLHVMGNMSWPKWLFFMATLPPSCFFVGINGWRWRLRRNIINKI